MVGDVKTFIAVTNTTMLFFGMRLNIPGRPILQVSVMVTLEHRKPIFFSNYAMGLMKKLIISVR